MSIEQEFTKQWFTAIEVAQMLGVAKKTIYNWKSLGKIKGENLHGSKYGRLRFHIDTINLIIGDRVQ